MKFNNILLSMAVCLSAPSVASDLADFTMEEFSSYTHGTTVGEVINNDFKMTPEDMRAGTNRDDTFIYGNGSVEITNLEPVGTTHGSYLLSFEVGSSTRKSDRTVEFHIRDSFGNTIYFYDNIFNMPPITHSIIIKAQAFEEGITIVGSNYTIDKIKIDEAAPRDTSSACSKHNLLVDDLYQKGYLTLKNDFVISDCEAPVELTTPVTDSTDEWFYASNMGEFTLAEAREYCNNLEAFQHSNWRLPRISETHNDLRYFPDGFSGYPFPEAWFWNKDGSATYLGSVLKSLYVNPDPNSKYQVTCKR